MIQSDVFENLLAIMIIKNQGPKKEPMRELKKSTNSQEGPTKKQSIILVIQRKK